MSEKASKQEITQLKAVIPAERTEERFIYLYSSMQELIDLADELDQKIAQVENGDKLRDLFYKLLKFLYEVRKDYE